MEWLILSLPTFDLRGKEVQIQLQYTNNALHFLESALPAAFHGFKGRNRGKKSPMKSKRCLRQQAKRKTPKQTEIVQPSKMERIIVLSSQQLCPDTGCPLTPSKSTSHVAATWCRHSCSAMTAPPWVLLRPAVLPAERKKLKTQTAVQITCLVLASLLVLGSWLSRC